MKAYEIIDKNGDIRVLYFRSYKLAHDECNRLGYRLVRSLSYSVTEKKYQAFIKFASNL